MADTPEAYYRNALDLNRFGNKVQNDLRKSYNRIIVDAVEQLARINEMPLETRPKYKAARLRALLKQTTESLAKWSGKSEKTVIKELQGLAKVQVDFAVKQLESALPAGMKSAVNSVEVSPSYAKSVVTKKATDLNASLLSDDLEAKVKGVPEKFSLTAKKGSQITLPNGDVLTKSFRGLAAKQADLFGRNIRDGLLSGETTQQMTRRLYGLLKFEGGGKATNNQISTLVKTSVQSVSNQAAQTVYEANQDITKQYKWIATLDSRTAPECRILDQTVHDYGQGPEPPQHFGCRCRTTAVLDYEGLGVDPPKYKYAKRAGEGGSVPIGQSYGNWLSKQSASYKAKALGASKVKYFNALTKKYGPDQALKKLVREDGSAKTLKQLKKTYGKNPSKKITAKPKPKVKTLTNTNPTTDSWGATSDYKEAIKRGESMTKGRFDETKSLTKDYKKAFEEFQDARESYYTYDFDTAYTGGVTYNDAITIYKTENAKRKAIWKTKKEILEKIEARGAKEMGVLRKELLKTNISDKTIKESLDKIPFTNQTKALQLGVRKDIEEFAKMFNGGGVSVKQARLSDGGQLTKVKLGTSRAYNELGEILVPFGDPTSVARTLKAKQTIFHEVGHSLEKITKNNLDMAVNWRTSRITSNIPTKAKTKVKRAWTLKEKVLPDEFISPYVGRPYVRLGSDRATEVVSMGVEHFATPELMFRLYSVDPDHFHMILSLTRNIY